MSSGSGDIYLRMQVLGVVMRRIWAASRKRHFALPMRHHHVDHLVAHLEKGCRKGCLGWESMPGRLSDKNEVARCQQLVLQQVATVARS